MPHTQHQAKEANKWELEEAKKHELEGYAQAYFKYTSFFQEQADAMRHNPQEMMAAHARITAECEEVQKRTPFTKMTVEDANKAMAEYARRCAEEPRTFDDRVRLSFSAMFYIQVMFQIVLQSPDRPPSDFKTVLGRGTQLLQEYLTGKPSEIPTIAPTIVKFTPDVKESRAVLLEDVKNWRSQPNELVGNCFISTDMVRRVFIVDDYSVKYRKGATYDILYEDLGLDEVESIDPEALLEMVADSELVLNVLPRL